MRMILLAACACLGFLTVNTSASPPGFVPGKSTQSKGKAAQQLPPGQAKGYAVPQQHPGNAKGYAAPPQQHPGNAKGYAVPQAHPGTVKGYEVPQQHPGYAKGYAAPHVPVAGPGVAVIRVEFRGTHAHVESSLDISNVVIQYTDGSQQRYTDLTGRSLVFCGCGPHAGKPICCVWVKSGANFSGDGPGYGQKFEAPRTTPSNAEPAQPQR